MSFFTFIKKRHPIGFILWVLTIAAFIAFGFYYYNLHNKAITTPPTIELSKDISNEFSIKASDEDLLKNITATDAQDGDVTGSIIIESLSAFVEPSTRIATYVAFDSDGNVAKKTRDIVYTDYQAPKIEPIKELKIKNKKVTEILSCFKATDVIDGDITKKIRLESIDTDTLSEVYPIKLSVTNSCGDVTTLSTQIEVIK